MSADWAWLGRWTFPAKTSLEATPLAVNGVLYFTGSYAAVYAVDGASRKAAVEIRSGDLEAQSGTRCVSASRVNRGVAYADGRIFSAAHRWPSVRTGCQDRPAALERRDHRPRRRSQDITVRRASSTAR